MTSIPPDKRKKLNAYLKYSGMAIQFFAVIAIGAWIGQKLDAYLQTNKPWMTIFCILFFSGGYFYKLYRDLTQ